MAVDSKQLAFGPVIARGRNGTVIYRGTFDGSPVAIKRLWKDYHDFARIENEKLLLAAQGHHPNIIRMVGYEEDEHYISLILEPYDCTLSQLYNKRPELWSCSTAYSYVSPALLVLMRDIVAGLAYLHSREIVHGNLKPSNVLIAGLCPKLSGMGGYMQQLDKEDESFLLLEHDDDDDTDTLRWVKREVYSHWDDLMLSYSTCFGGWQAPETSLYGPVTKEMDVFVLGSVLFFCLSEGRHPFGGVSRLGDHLDDHFGFQVDANVKKLYTPKLNLVRHIPEAKDLFSRLLNHDPIKRPKALEVLHHPLFWIPKMRSLFLSDAGDMLGREDEKAGIVLGALESRCGTLYASWDHPIDSPLISQIEMETRTEYNYNMIQDLLRFLEDTKDSYIELPTHIQKQLGPLLEGVDLYFRQRFPTLLMDVYDAMYLHCKQDKWFKKYMDIEFLNSEISMSAIMTSDAMDGWNPYPSIFPGNSFAFEFKDFRGCICKFTFGTKNLGELVSEVTQRMGAGSSDQSELQLLYDDDEGDRVLLETDSDLGLAVSHARSAGKKVLRLHLDYYDSGHTSYLQNVILASAAVFASAVGIGYLKRLGAFN